MIYYVEDDPNIRDLVIYTLRQTGLEARGFSGADTFFSAMQEAAPEVILLDIMLPGEDGLSILKRLRASQQTCGIPVIMITARDTEYDTVVGLDAGADDYIAKPFGMMELVARVKAILRRTTAKVDAESITVGELTVDNRRHVVTVSGEAVQLTLKEFELLRFLMENRGVAFTREKLLERVWDLGYGGGTRTVDVHVQTLRQKLGAASGKVETVRGVGYRFGG
jgi:two-component system, OmpR family, alkaline phosphatase synthesis response regulator PhoP